MRAFKSLALVTALVLVACAVAPRVVTVIVPYVPVLPLDPTNRQWLGAATCDLNGQPVIYLHPALSDDMRPFVELHERVHVLQMNAFGGCRRFDDRVKADSMFRLHVEAEAYCSVLTTQRQMHRAPEPTYASIVRQLAEDYSFAYERDSVVAALPCKGEPETVR